MSQETNRGNSIGKIIKADTGRNATQLYSTIVPPYFKAESIASTAINLDAIQVNMSTVNIVKYYFYKGMIPKDQDRLRQLVALAYETARNRKLYPKAVLIRCVQNLDSSHSLRWARCNTDLSDKYLCQMLEKISKIS